MGAFSWFGEKRSKNRRQETPTVEAHYIRLARRTSLIRYVCLIAVVVFAVYSLSFHSNEITIENFEYMIKFINLGEEADSPTGSLISFDGSEGNRGLIYKGDLAVLNESGLAVTGWDGDVILKETFTFDHPKMEENGVNLFCYDLGGKELRIFNSYSQVSKFSYDYPIYWLSASESGAFAVASSAKGYRSAVYVYDSNFRIIYSRLFGDKYVDFTDISSDGQGFITAAHYSKNGNLITKVSRFATNSEDSLFDIEFIGEIPLGIYYTDSGYCLITSDALRMFDNSDSVVAEIKYEDRKLLSSRVFDDCALVNYSLEGLSGGTETVIYNLDGTVLFDYKFDTSLSDVSVNGNTLYALSPGKLSQCNVETGEVRSYSIPTSYSAIVADGERIILFSESQAEYFNAENYSRKEQ